MTHTERHRGSLASVGRTACEALGRALLAVASPPRPTEVLHVAAQLRNRGAETVVDVVAATGEVVAVRHSDPPRRGLVLHTLTEPTTYLCTDCGHRAQRSAVATSQFPRATRSQALLCPGCHHRLIQ